MVAARAYSCTNARDDRRGYKEYYPDGTTAWWAGGSSIDVSWKRYRYTGKAKDEETGLYYHGARYYAPWLGRWASADPIGRGGGIDRYRYVRSPLRFVDPTGLRESTPQTSRGDNPKAKLEIGVARQDPLAPPTSGGDLAGNLMIIGASTIGAGAERGIDAVAAVKALAAYASVSGPKPDLLSDQFRPR